jgi:NAD(P)-dependent dehydrogenase (short-subunit alcohol dehydrogenase family)
MARIVILGAAGSLGRHVLRQALAAGHDVVLSLRGRGARLRARTGRRPVPNPRMPAVGCGSGCQLILRLKLTVTLTMNAVGSPFKRSGW